MSESISVKQNASDFASTLLTKLKSKSKKATPPSTSEPKKQKIIKGKLGLGADEKQKDAERNSARGRTSAKLKKSLKKRTRRQVEDEEEEDAEDIEDDIVESKASVAKAAKSSDPLEDLLAEKSKKSQRRKQKRQGGSDAKNPFADPSFDADKEQAEFTTNWIEDARDELLIAARDDEVSIAKGKLQKKSKPREGVGSQQGDKTDKPKRKRPKKRSKQKNLRKDTRPAHLKPSSKKQAASS